MIITREIINKNIKFHDIVETGDGKYTQFDYGYDQLNIAIDLYKNLLIDSGVKPQDTVTITEKNCIWQLAALFASFELGLKVAITDYLTEAMTEKINHEVFEVDTKTKVLLPIDYLLCSSIELERNDNNLFLKKISYLDRIIGKVIIRKFSYQHLYHKPKNVDSDISAHSNHIATKSSTSGTTGSPKCIEHSHEFLYELLERNSKLFSGNFLSYRNLNHGSSIFCYCIPAITSKSITDFYSVIAFSFDEKYNIPSVSEFFNIFFKKISHQETHVVSNYAAETEVLLKSLEDENSTNVIIHVLSYIQKEWVEQYYVPKRVGDIISNFGSNETTGPLFLNKASTINFSEQKYQLYDDFFKIDLLGTGIAVNMPVYNKTVMMEDRFEKQDEKYFTYSGRSNHIRINDIEVDLQKYESIIEDYYDSTLVYDKINSKIYLAIWNNDIFNRELILENLYKINQRLKDLSLDRHYISKYNVLNYENYLSGIKLDMEKLREYFRNPNENYKIFDQM